jgi:ABC-type branched-subunit amino acid transport system permease subunit
MVLIGGLDSVLGAVIGAFLVTSLPTIVPSFVTTFVGPTTAIRGPAVAEIIYGCSWCCSARAHRNASLDCSATSPARRR